MPKLQSVQIEEHDNKFIVVPVWADVDRQRPISYSCGSNKKLAYRLAKAIRAKVVFSDIKRLTNTMGASYVSAHLNIRMRCANADLKKLGY